MYSSRVRRLLAIPNLCRLPLLARTSVVKVAVFRAFTTCTTTKWKLIARPCVPGGLVIRDHREWRARGRLMPVKGEPATRAEILLRFGTYFCALRRGARRYDK